jgi:acyl-CoA dehydrogenase
VLKRWHDDGRQPTDLPFVQWAVEDSEQRIQDAFFGLFQNFPERPAAWLLRLLVFPYGKTFRAPDDRLGHRVSSLMMEDSPARDRLTAGMFIDRRESDPVGRLELALQQVASAEQIEAKVRAAVKSGAVHAFTTGERIAAAVRAGAISAQEAETLGRYEELRRACIMVDDFPPEIGRHAASELDKAADFSAALMARKIA